jgi:hypothetical protein
MAKKKKGLAAFVSKKNSEEKAAPVRAKDNPPPLTDFAEFIAPGFVGYAGTRFASRVIHQMALKRFPKLAKHASVLSTFGAATLAWLLVHRVKRVQKFHTPVVVGAGIAALQTAVQAYIPKYGWLVSDHNLNEAPPALPPAQPNALPPAQPNGTQVQVPVAGFPWAKAKAAAAPEVPPSSDDLDELQDLDLGSLASDDVDGDGLSDDDIDELLN